MKKLLLPALCAVLLLCGCAQRRGAGGNALAERLPAAAIRRQLGDHDLHRPDDGRVPRRRDHRPARLGKRSLTHFAGSVDQFIIHNA